ncbi:hypothetical protein LCGC14_0777860 [marine sediment metagenome]|uniref:Uncharacterized protein n=1 Tax=marine sediment metagenome TaxID=412755 RepID=A0A0F9Q0K9_9ZZZZ
MMLEMMFDWLWHRFLGAMLFTLGVVLAYVAAWLLSEAIESYQAAQQALYLR